MTTKYPLFFFLLVLPFVLACNLSAIVADSMVDPGVALEYEQGGTVIVHLGLTNQGPMDIKGNADDQTNSFEIRSINGTLRASGQGQSGSLLEARSSSQLIEWKGQLDPGVYILTWNVAPYRSKTVKFEVFEDRLELLQE
jgi:hypothetical protein